MGEEAIDTSCAFHAGHLELPHLMLTLNPLMGICLTNEVNQAERHKNNSIKFTQLIRSEQRFEPMNPESILFSPITPGMSTKPPPPFRVPWPRNLETRGLIPD